MDRVDGCCLSSSITLFLGPFTDRVSHRQGLHPRHINFCRREVDHLEGAQLPLDDANKVAPSKTLRRLRATIWLAAAVPLLMFALVALNLHQRALAEARLRVDSAARIAEENALKVFETNTALLNLVADALDDDPEDVLRARERSLHEQMVRMTANLRHLQGLFVMGPSGRMIVCSM